MAWRMRGTSAMSMPVPTIIGIPIGNLQQPISTVDHLPVDHARLRGEPVRLSRSNIIDVLHFVPVCDQPVRHQHAMTTKVHTLCAHIRRSRLFCQNKQLNDGAPELRREHVIGVIAETLIPEGDVGRLFENLLAISSQLFYPDIRNSSRRKTFLQ